MARQAVIDKTNPPFTLQQLRDAIPKHCFEASALRSATYVVRDLLCAGALWLLVAPWIDAVASPVLRWALWGLFAVVQGTILTGVWVVAHECGHGAFSASDAVNGAVGLVLHSFLLVPFFSWKFTHAAHHGATNHLRQDQVFVPMTAAEAGPYRRIFDVLADAPLLNLLFALRMFVVGWPAYLLLNVSGQESQMPSSHFWPSSPIFTPKQRRLVVVSNWGLGAMIALLAWDARTFGVAHLVTRYVLPYLVVNFWLIFYTFMQHTDKALPHYDTSEWTFIRGALATIDRPYHWIDFFHHEIGTTHVLHHFFSRIPHYHAAEATRAIRPILGKFYMQSSQNVFAAFWEQYRDCKFVDSDKNSGSDGVLWFRHKY